MTETSSVGLEAGVAVSLALSRCGMNAASAWADEVSRFVGHRLAADTSYLVALSASPTPAVAAEATAAYVDGATADYLALAQKAGTLILAAPADGLASAEDGFDPPGPLPIE